jgi:hypothetical protein
MSLRCSTGRLCACACRTNAASSRSTVSTTPGVWLEGRARSERPFDTKGYLAAYADVNAAKVDPLTHFLAYGAQEGRQPFNDGVWPS